MQEEGDGKPTGDPILQPMGPPTPLPRASEELEREDLHPTLLPELGDDHKRRYHEAWVKEQETHAKQADDDREMRKDIAERVFRAKRSGIDRRYRLLHLRLCQRLAHPR